MNAAPNRGVNDVLQQMNAIKKCGIRFSLEAIPYRRILAFSSWNMLPFDEVKIDGSFVSSI